jgi:hypothetical protein
MIYKITAPVAVARQLDAPSLQREGERLPQKSGQRIASFPSKPWHASWIAARKEMKEASLKSKKKRGPGYQVSRREVKNLQSSLGRYWEEL